MENKDVRWIQRFNNYKKALEYLKEAIKESEEHKSIETLKAGVIQCFEMVYELAWNTMKDFYENEGEINIQGSRDAIRLAFKRGLIEDGHNWMKMIETRMLTVHTYNKEKAVKTYIEIKGVHLKLFLQLEARLEAERIDLM